MKHVIVPILHLYLLSCAGDDCLKLKLKAEETAFQSFSVPLVCCFARYFISAFIEIEVVMYVWLWNGRKKDTALRHTKINVRDCKAFFKGRGALWC